MLSSSCQSQTIRSDNKFTHHLHQLWLEVNNIMRWSLFWIAGSGLGSWSSWWTGRAMGTKRTPGWVNMTSMHHNWFHSSIATTLVHLIAFVRFTLPAWTSVLVYQYHDFAAVRLMHPWRGGDVRGTPKFQYSDSATLQLMQHFVIPATLCNHPLKKSHQVATPIDHPVCVAYCLPLPYHSPFYFCALLLPSYFISISFHILFPILSIFHILLLSLFCDLLLVAMHSVPYVVPLCLGSP